MEKIVKGTRRAISRKELFHFLRSGGETMQPTTSQTKRRLLEYVTSKFNVPIYDETLRKKITTKIRLFCYNLSTKWKATHRIASQFLEKHSAWLNKDILFFEAPKISGGRPKKTFSACSEKSKKRKISNLLNSRTLPELSFAVQSGYCSVGKRDAAAVISAVTSSSPRTLRRIKGTCFSNMNVDAKCYTPEEALALIVDLKLTKHQYISLRIGARKRNVDIYPPYYAVLKAKEQCYPEEDSIIVTDKLAEIKLQSLLDHTVARLAKVQQDVLEQTLQNSDDHANLQILYKWGCDGSGGHSIYKQKFSTVAMEKNTDADILMTSVVPLQLYFESENNEKLVLWQNPRTSSTRFCIPLRFQYIKETTEKTQEEFNHVECQIERLTPTKLIVNAKEVFVHHKLIKSMVDGKVCNSIMQNSSQQVCYICGAAPKDMNDLDKVMKRSCNKSSFAFGLSTLHAHIRFFECLLHISYKLEIKKWQARGKEEKAQVQARKAVIIERFWSVMHLLVDIPKQGSGTSNDGNTARRFFNDPDKAAEITGIDIDLIRRFSVILTALSSGYSINVEFFREYANETAKLYVTLYKWYYMPASIHKILIHGADVIDTMLLPIGQLSEDVQEARHKEYRKYRECHTRKSSRKNTNEDLLHNLLLSSDPVISSIRQLPVKKATTLPKEVLSLLKVPEPANTRSERFDDISDLEEEEAGTSDIY